jgi:hypothetical protein
MTSTLVDVSSHYITHSNRQLHSQRLAAVKNESSVQAKALDHVLSIYSQDGPHRLLDLPLRSFDDLEVHDQATVAEDHIRRLIMLAETFDDYCDSSDECAVYSDVEEDDESSTAEDHHGHMAGPRGTTTTTKTTSSRSTSLNEEPHENDTGIRDAETQVKLDAAPSVRVSQGQHVRAIPGQMMGLWPLPVEDEDYGFYAAGQKDERLSMSEHAGKLMSWWPLPIGDMEYDWTERFYE